ncbi:MAG TPA: C45 family autoproteolytic acyltransferase/hydrolase [Polyangiaceae bacterium]|nr:C45 family autoproteolytic acyltransferase/hydrolase [Polyangiaceae bacterium]
MVMRPAILVPAFDAVDTIAGVVSGLRRELGEGLPIFVVDDGSRDGTSEAAREAGAIVVRHPENRGKGAAIRTGLAAMRQRGCNVAVTVDADGQHPADQAARLLDACADETAIVLGTRDLAKSGAPRGNVIGNRASNFFVSIFNRRRFRDTQCGLRRYPVETTLALRTHDQRFGFEAEVIFAAVRAGVPIHEAPVRVLYPPRSRHRTHYRAFRDTVHIVLRITATVFFPVRWVVVGLAAMAVLGFGAHPTIVFTTRMLPPQVVIPSEAAKVDPRDADLSWAGSDYARHRGKIWEVALSGSPEQIGSHLVSLLRPEMLANEAELWTQLETLVPSAWARVLIFDLARIRFRNIDQLMSEPRRREIAAAASTFVPDPWTARIPSYQRMVYLHSLYDVSLSFEHSPLLGCTSFALTDGAAENGHTFLARVFDFEAGRLFDEHKAVFLVRERGKIPYASVAWPGLVGVVTGMNDAGLALVVHGGRAREAQSSGTPLVHTMRDILGEARSTAEALAMLKLREPMVSHIVMLADRSGDAAVVERAPGETPFVRREKGKLALTNHFQGPLADDPANRQIEQTTSTLHRRARLDELLARLPPGASVEDAIAILRDKRGLGDVVLPPGDRRAIDALIATHGVVMDTTARVIWVSEGPHLKGRFVRFDVARLLSSAYDPRAENDVVVSSADSGF